MIELLPPSLTMLQGGTTVSHFSLFFQNVSLTAWQQIRQLCSKLSTPVSASVSHIYLPFVDVPKS